MKTDLTTTVPFVQPKSPNKGELAKNLGPKTPVSDKDLSVRPESKNIPDYKVELSSTKPPSPKIDIPDLPESAPKKIPEKIVQDEIKNKASVEVKKVASDAPKEGHLKRPAIFFIKGLDVFSSPSKSERGYAGVGRMAESIEGSRIYGWDQKDEIINEIKKTHKDFPVILVGHSFGGDTALEIAEEFDTLKEKFKGIDLLITIDAVGFSNDVVPQNVKNHFNVFGEKSLLLNDGPHVARREEKTAVRNMLTNLEHTDIDDDSEIQFEVTELIQKTLKEKLSSKV